MGLTPAQLWVLGFISRLEASGVEEIHQNDLERIEHVTHPATQSCFSGWKAKVTFVRCTQ